ncbi:MAG: hypothetical protein AAEJ04_10705 [Planctomycetota bacterium]
MTSIDTNETQAGQLLKAFQDQALIYEQLLASCDVSGVDLVAQATEAAQAQQKIREIHNSVAGVLECWGEISSTIDPELCREVSLARKRIQEAIMAVLSRHEALLGDLGTSHSNQGELATGVPLVVEETEDSEEFEETTEEAEAPGETGKLEDLA